MTSRATRATHGRVEYLNPRGLPKSPAFTNVAVVSGPVRTIYIGGQDAVSGDNEVVGKGDLAAQTEQILKNIQTALAAADAGLEHVIKWNVFVVEGQPIDQAHGAFQRIWGQRPNPPLIP
jgi:enamine deaminase RidA (YjgF/YER057c/UK114 family)